MISVHRRLGSIFHRLNELAAGCAIAPPILPGPLTFCFFDGRTHRTVDAVKIICRLRDFGGLDHLRDCARSHNDPVALSRVVEVVRTVFAIPWSDFPDHLCVYLLASFGAFIESLPLGQLKIAIKSAKEL